MMNLSFAQKIIVPSVVTLILALSIFSTVNYFSIKNEIEKELRSRMVQISASTSNYMSNWLQTKLSLIESISQNIKSASSDRELTRLISVVNQGGSFRNVFYGTEQGQFLIDDTNKDDLTGFDPRVRPWYKLAASKKESSFSEPYVDAFTAELLITAVAPSIDSGLKGVVGGDLSLKIISEQINNIDLEGIGFAFLVDKHGKILVHPEADKINANLSDLYQGELKIGGRMQKGESLENKTRLLNFYPLEGVPSIQWQIVIDIDEALAYQSSADFRNSAIFLTIIVALLGSLLLSFILKTLIKPIHSLRDALYDIAQGEGDLTRRLDVISHDELGQVATAFNSFIENIHILIEDFKGSSDNLAVMVQKMVQTSERSRNECIKQQTETDMVAAAVSQMSAAAQEIALSAQNASDAAKNADSDGAQAGQIVGEAIETIQKLAQEVDSSTSVINELENEVSNISQMVDVIRGIADQTNLLALNAAIEAARAGEQGRGFAVVADEVRTLASKTQESTEEINRQIERLQSGSTDAVNAMAQSKETGDITVSKALLAGEALERIAHAVSTISDMNIQIATASEEQTSVTEDIARNVTAIADATVSVTQAATEADSNSQHLAEIGVSIRDKVDRFRV